MAVFSVEEARAELVRLWPLLQEFVSLRADAAELAASLQSNDSNATSLGGIPEFKAAQARLDEILTEVQESGVELKSIAPLLLDFPAELDGKDVLLCWVEGEEWLGWYHSAGLGFAGRRPLD